MTACEIVAAVKRSELPTILVEGVQDKQALRLLDSLTGKKGKVLSCSGRNNLFKVWERRGEFAGKRIAFLADRDLYVIKRIPAEFKGIIFTDGYSLENDMLESKRWMSLQDAVDKLHYDKMTKLNIDHFWVQTRTFIDTGTSPQWMSAHSLKENNFVLSPHEKLKQSKCGLYRRISSNPIRYIRGKNVLHAVHYSLSHKMRHVKYRPEQIMEMCTMPKPKGKMRMLLNKIRSEIIN